MPSAGWYYAGATGSGSGTATLPSGGSTPPLDLGFNLAAYSASDLCAACQVTCSYLTGGTTPPTTATFQWSSTTGVLTPVGPSFSFSTVSTGFGNFYVHTNPSPTLNALYFDEDGHNVGGSLGGSNPNLVPSPIITGAVTLFVTFSGAGNETEFQWNAVGLCEVFYYFQPAPSGEVLENLYSCNGVFDYSATRGDVLKSLIGSMAGTVIPPGDEWHIFAGAYNPPTTVLTDADLRDSIKGDFRVSRRDICNGVKGQFIPAYLPTNQTQAQPSAWRWTDFPPYQGNGLLGHPNYILEDGGAIIWKAARFGFTTSIWAVQRLAKILLQLLRFQVTLHLACKLTAFPVQAGDTVTFIHARWAALANPPPTTFFVTQCTLVMVNEGGVPALGVDLVLRQHDPSIYFFQAPTSISNQGEYSSYGSLGTM